MKPPVILNISIFAAAEADLLRKEQEATSLAIKQEKRAARGYGPRDGAGSYSSGGFSQGGGEFSNASFKQGT